MRMVAIQTTTHSLLKLKGMRHPTMRWVGQRGQSHRRSLTLLCGKSWIGCLDITSLLSELFDTQTSISALGQDVLAIHSTTMLSTLSRPILQVELFPSNQNLRTRSLFLCSMQQETSGTVPKTL